MFLGRYIGRAVSTNFLDGLKKFRPKVVNEIDRQRKYRAILQINSDFATNPTDLCVITFPDLDEPSELNSHEFDRNYDDCCFDKPSIVVATDTDFFDDCVRPLFDLPKPRKEGKVASNVVMTRVMNDSFEKELYKVFPNAYHMIKAANCQSVRLVAPKDFMELSFYEVRLTFLGVKSAEPVYDKDENGDLTLRANSASSLFQYGVVPLFDLHKKPEPAVEDKAVSICKIPSQEFWKYMNNYQNSIYRQVVPSCTKIVLEVPRTYREEKNFAHLSFVGIRGSTNTCDKDGNLMLSVHTGLPMFKDILIKEFDLNMDKDENTPMKNAQLARATITSEFMAKLERHVPEAANALKQNNIKEVALYADESLGCCLRFPKIKEEWHKHFDIFWANGDVGLLIKPEMKICVRGHFGMPAEMDGKKPETAAITIPGCKELPKSNYITCTDESTKSNLVKDIVGDTYQDKGERVGYAVYYEGKPGIFSRILQYNPDWAGSQPVLVQSLVQDGSVYPTKEKATEIALKFPTAANMPPNDFYPARVIEVRLRKSLEWSIVGKPVEETDANWCKHCQTITKTKHYHCLACKNICHTPTGHYNIETNSLTCAKPAQEATA